MHITKNQVTAGLLEIGASWAVTDQKCILPSDGSYARPTYHVYPDSEWPFERYIMRFNNLQSLWSWIKACKWADELHRLEPHNLYKVIEIVEGSYGVTLDQANYRILSRRG